MSRYQEFIKSFEKSVIKNKRYIEEIELIAVSKRQSTQDIISIINEGHLSFGENQLQEVEKKWLEIRKKIRRTRLNFIGSIQSKKMVDIINHCDAIHTVDREKLIPIIKRIDKSILKKKSFFVQINTGNEAQKSGVNLDRAEKFIELCHNNEIKINGLMCIPPENDPPEKHFQIMQSIAKNNHVKNLSMGMSNDFDVAIKYGSTHIRIGTAIFGKRN